MFPRMPNTRIRSVVLAMVALVAGPGASPAATVPLSYDITLTRTASDEAAPTFSGSGVIRFDGASPSLGGISFLSLDVITLGAVFGDDGTRTPVEHRFLYGTDDVLAATGLSAQGGSLVGSLLLADLAAAITGAVIMGSGGAGGLLLDFTAGLAEGFCFSAALPVAECIRGGGTSTSVEARLGTADVPLPNPVWLLGTALFALGCLARRQSRPRRRRRPRHAAASAPGDLPEPAGRVV